MIIYLQLSHSLYEFPVLVAAFFVLIFLANDSSVGLNRHDGSMQVFVASTIPIYIV